MGAGVLSFGGQPQDIIPDSWKGDPERVHPPTVRECAGKWKEMKVCKDFPSLFVVAKNLLLQLRGALRVSGPTHSFYR